MGQATLLKLCTGRVREATFGERTTRTAIHKTPVDDAYLGLASLVGDEVANPEHHGGIEQAVLLYASEHYPKWEAELELPAPWAPGSFGENLHLQGLTEAEACLGDVWAVGPEVQLEFSCPRQPCYKLAGHLQRPDLVKAVWATGRAGWYARVRQVGTLAPGQSLRLLERPNPDWSFGRILRLLAAPAEHREALGDAAALAAWPEAWKARLAKLAGAN